MRFAQTLWWVRILVSVRSSIHWMVVPGMRRDDLVNSGYSAEPMAEDDGWWWRPVAAG